jgi:hypothetical protein
MNLKVKFVLIVVWHGNYLNLILLLVNLEEDIANAIESCFLDILERDIITAYLGLEEMNDELR